MAMGRRRLSMAMRATACALAVCSARMAIVHGGQVEEMSVSRMANLAGQVIVGQVAQARSYWAENPRRIETEVIFTHTEYAKGAHPGAGESFYMVVPGGTVDDWTLRVAGAPEFAVGETWMLFVLPTYKTHPVVGVFRGAFRVNVDASGVERVFDADRKAIQRIDERGVIVSAVSERHHVTLSGQHSPIHVTESRDETEVAMTLAAFRAAIQPILDQSRDYQLSEPAGRREAVTYVPVPLTPHVQAGMAVAPERGARGAVPRQQVDRTPSATTKQRGRQ